MCGIYGTIGGQSKSNSLDASQIVYQGLKRLEYRGYDSWGVVVTKNGQLSTHKQVGKIGSTSQLQLPAARAAIGHTRWATHGGVTQINAHPHLAHSGTFALVQNGVVENYQLLKQELADAGYEFVSETDTEVIVGVLERVMEERGELLPTRKSVREAFSQLDGRNTIAVLTDSETLFAVRNGSPLVVGRNDSGNWFISSDVLSLAVDAHEYLLVDHGQGIEITDGQLKLFTIKTGEELPAVFQLIDLESTRLDKEGYDHFMLKEIYDQATVLENVLQQPVAQLEQFISRLRQAKHVYTLGAGSASYAAQSTAFFLRQQGVAAQSIPSYEARSYQQQFSRDDVCLALSQSGETADTNEVVAWMQQQGVQIASLVNMPGSTLTSESDWPFMLQVGPEVAVASTKAFAGQVVWGWAISQLIAGKELNQLQLAVQRYQQQLARWFEGDMVPQLQQLARELQSHDHLFVLGRGQLHAPALEFALKMKEISYIHAEGFSGGELKHGVIALIEEGTPVVCLVADDAERSDMLSAAAEVQARGARVIGVAAANNELYDDWILVPKNPDLIVLSSFIPAQLLTYYLALEKGYDPDKPRNLAKSVTVK